MRDNVDICPYFTLLNMTIAHLDWGVSLLEIDLAEKHLQPFGIVHGGVCASLLDATAFWAVYTQLDPKEGLTTTELKINYLAPAVKGRLIGHGRTIKAGRSLCLGEARIEDHDGRLIAHGTATMMRLNDLPLKSAELLPPKYIE